MLRLELLQVLILKTPPQDLTCFLVVQMCTVAELETLRSGG